MDLQPEPQTGESSKRRARVVITGNAKEEIEKLKNIANQEISKGITSSTSQTLLNSIMQKIEFLKKDPDYGVHIVKNKIPKEYLLKYEVNNLWKINLSGAWRMIYTIRGKEIEILSLILDIVSHRDYEKKFGYRKS